MVAVSSFAVAVVVGCGDFAYDSASSFAPEAESGGDFGSPTEEFVSDAGGSPGAARGSNGNPLCSQIVGSECVPDTATGCGPRGQGDAGFEAVDVDGDAPQPNHGMACHVVPVDGGAAPLCSAAGQGEDGAECIQSADCAVGFECVGSPGQCRRYCCNGQDSCGGDGRQFCDIQARAEQGNKVPVCMPVRSCALLGSGCPQGQTCAIVLEDGTTSCVGIGSAQAGESCEEEHCAENLTCLGQRERRRCYKLCEKTASMACSNDERCKGAAPLFQDPGVGICGKL